MQMKTLLLALALAALAGPAMGQHVAAKVTAGSNHTCVLTSAGAVRCWGDNSLSQLGDGTKTQRGLPVDVVGLSSGVTDIASRAEQTCAIVTGGGVKCWGLPNTGDVPVAIAGLESGVTQVGAGWLHACALQGGVVKCWGQNFAGQLGDGTTIDRSTPAPVIGLEGAVTAIAVGVSHACALTAARAVKCWGRNHRGQLGDGLTTFQQRTLPVEVVNLAGTAAAISANAEQSCAITLATSVVCWGVQNVFLTGNDVADVYSATPANVGGLNFGVASIHPGYYHHCALTPSGGAKCWGWNGGYQLGDSTQTFSYQRAVDVPGLSSGVISIAGGTWHTCAVLANGRVRCWGRNQLKQLGDDTLVDRPQGAWVIGFSQPSESYQGLWWHAPEGSEAGWGVNLTHQGETLFATWFTYDEAGAGMWLVMSNGAKTGEASFSGPLYRTSGPAFSAVPWNGSQVSPITLGTASFTFTDASNGTFTFTVNGVTQSKPITRQIYAAGAPACSVGGALGTPPNYQDLWWRQGGSEPGWGVNITHQGNILFATWFTYDASGRGLWLVMSDGRSTGPGTWSGTLYRTTGPAFNAPWNAALVTATAVGNAVFSFSDADNATFTYTLNGITQSKPITRQVFSSPVTACR
jgi:alpha-tubulin suppressor-like RCC1 family protein